MFEAGKSYVRREIHRTYGGQQQGGISTPKTHPVVLLFTGETGKHFGYEDKYLPSGVFRYTGEGQNGDMAMVRGNRAIRDHQANGRALHLFENSEPGIVAYVGEAFYLSHHIEERPDRNEQLRRAIIFDLSVEISTSATTKGAIGGEPSQRLWTRPISEVREIAQQPAARTTSATERRQITYARSKAVRVYVLRRAAGFCEHCGKRAPFNTNKRRPYLEPHHLKRLADGGPDDPESVAAVCPNCHREIHYGIHGNKINRDLMNRVLRLERSGKPQ